MVLSGSSSRRGFLTAAGSAVLATRLAHAATLPRRAGLADNVPEDGYIIQSQRLPEPAVVLPTDALGPPKGPKKRIAAVTTTYFKYSHADDIITKFIEGYAVVGRTHLPHCDVVSLSIEQFPSSDIGRGMAARYNIPLFDTPAAALTLGGTQLAVDGVLLVGEHGDYPFNENGQHLYPRRRLFGEIVKVFRRSGRSVPVYNDKHFSYSWRNAEWMYRQSRELGFPMMAGSSVPVTWRRPPLDFRSGVPLQAALGVGYAGVESYGFHTLEVLQCFAERRPHAETGVKAVRALEGETAWTAAAAGEWSAELLAAALSRTPGAPAGLSNFDALRRADPNAVVFLIDYSDGFRGAAYVSRGLVQEFAFAARVQGQDQPVSTWCYLPKPQRDHFSFLCNHIEVMFRTGRSSYPVERTYLVTGMLAALMESYHAGGRRVATPHLERIAYTPAAPQGGGPRAIDAAH